MSSEPILDAPTRVEQSELLARSGELLRGRGTQAEYVGSELEPAHALVEVATVHRADLIVVGQTGSGFVTRALLGSTAENVVRNAPCDVLVVA